MECKICKNKTKSDKNKTCSKICALILKKEDKYNSYNFEIEIKKILKEISLKEIKDLIEKNNHSFGMIYDLLVRDYSLDKKFSLKQVRNYFKTKCEFDLDAYNKMPQSFKLQYRYDKSSSIEEVKKDIANKCRVGQKITSILNKGSKKPNFKRENSPVCIEFYTSRGLSLEEAKERILKINISGAVAVQKIKCSGLERKIKSILDLNQIQYESQISINLLPEEKIYNKQRYIFDIFIPRYNLLIECNGLYWHASRNIYKSGDLIKLPRHGNIKVDYVWEMDKHKQEIAKKRNFNSITIWEDEYENTMEIINEVVGNNGNRIS